MPTTVSASGTSFIQNYIRLPLGPSSNNFDNINNGGCMRLLNRQSSDGSIPLLNNILLVWADSSKDLTRLDSGLDDLNNYYLNILYGRI